MTIEANKLAMGRFTEFINTASEALAAELISPNAVFHVPGRDTPMRGPSGYLAIIQMMRSGFPDIQWALEEMVAEADKVAARFTMRGTHQGVFFGVPPTGKQIEVKAMNIYRLSGGQFIEGAWSARSIGVVAADRSRADLGSTTVSPAKPRNKRFNLTTKSPGEGRDVRSRNRCA
jgi:steroid delta-isomerase-like uncharacterized protein